MQDEIAIFIGIPIYVPPGARYAVSFINQIQVVISGDTHNLGTADLVVQLYENIPSDPLRYYLQGAWSINEVSYDVTINFPIPQSGRCVIIR